MSIMPFDRTEESNIRIHVLPTDRFKTYAVSLYIGSPLTEQDVTPNALTPFVLRRGTKRLPETKQFREKLDELYGAGFGFDIYKRGNNQIVQFRMDTIADRYTEGQSNKQLLQETLHFLIEAITKPYLENNAFAAKYVASEKNTVSKRLEAIINDKIRYAAERCTQVMFADDPFRYNALGRQDQLDAQTPESLYAHYREWLRQAQIDLYVVGDTSLQVVQTIVKAAWAFDKQAATPYRFELPALTRADVQTVTEQLDVSQGKLNMGLTLPILYADSDYTAALLYNGILGGYPHSKLFVNVREKASLAYYASSRYDGFKGMLMLQSGIEIDQYDKAVAIIKAQFDELTNGNISELELSQTKAMMTNQLKEISDSAFEMIAFDFNRVLTGSERTITGLIEDIQTATRDQVVAVAGKVKLNTIYFLRDRKGGQ